MLAQNLETACPAAPGILPSVETRPYHFTLLVRINQTRYSVLISGL